MSFTHNGQQRRKLADGINMGALGLCLMFMGLSVGFGLDILGSESVAKWFKGMSIAMFGTLTAFGFGTGIAGYWNYDA